MSNLPKETVVHALNLLANHIEVKTVKLLKKKKMVAWGKLWQSIKTKVDDENLTIDVFADESIAPYAQYVHEGRQPGKMPPVRPIEEWLRKKRIPPRDEDLAKRLQGTKLTVRKKVNERALFSKKQNELADHYETTAWKIAQKMKREGMKPKRFLIAGIVEALRDLPR
jgi:hypothetical protein